MIDTPPLRAGGGGSCDRYTPHMGDIVDFHRPEKFDAITGICSECGNDAFETLFGPEDSHQARHLIALRCNECGEEVASREQLLDS